MNLRLPHNDLVVKIRHHGRHLVESQQIVRRLRRLIRTMPCPSRKEGPEPGRRQARQFLHSAYPGLIDEYIAMQAERLEAKVQYETHLMLLNARQSLRSFRF